MKTTTLSILLFFLAVLSACAHKIDIQQGNVLTAEMLDQIKIGMNERQVISVVGSPLIVDPFHKNRWDYIYSMKIGNTDEFQYSYVTLFFSERSLQEIKTHKEPIAEKDMITPELVSRGR